MPVKAVDKNGKILTFDTDREARLFGTEPISDEAAGIPKRPDYAGMTNPATGGLQDRFKVGEAESLSDYTGGQVGGINLNTQGLEEIRKRSLAEGPSKWEQLALGKAGTEEANALDRATREGSRASAQAESEMAMRGGVSGGERERVGYQSARDTAEARQKVGAEGVAARANIGLAGEEQKIGLLKGLPGMEEQSLNPAFKKAEFMSRAKESDIAGKRQADILNVAALQKDLLAKNAFDMGSYGELRKAYGATEEAKATAAGGGGTHICTAVHREYPITDKDLETLDSFRSAAMDYFPEVFKFYLTKCEDLIPKMKEAGADVGMLRPFVTLIFKYIDTLGVEYALDFYADYTEELVKLYLPEHYEEALRVRAITASN